MVFDLSEGNLKNMEAHFTEIKKLKTEASEHRKKLLNELAEAGMLLLNREDFLRLAVQLGEIVDYCEGAAYRINYIVSKKLNLDTKMPYDKRISLHSMRGTTNWNREVDVFM